MSLYNNSKAAAVTRAAKAFADRNGINDPAKIAALKDFANTKILDQFKGVKGLTDANATQIAEAVFTHMQRAPTTTLEDLDKGKAAAFDRVRSLFGIGATAKAHALIARTQAREAVENPERHRLMGTTPEVAGIGSDPRIVMPLIEEQIQRDQKAARAPYRGGFKPKAPTK